MQEPQEEAGYICSPPEFLNARRTQSRYIKIHCPEYNFVTHIHEKMTLQFLLSPINDSFDWVDAYHLYWAILPHFLGLLVFNNKTYKTPYRFSVSTISKRHSTKYKIRERGQN